jgi:hypothetical protein
MNEMKRCRLCGKILTHGRAYCVGCDGSQCAAEDNAPTIPFPMVDPLPDMMPTVDPTPSDDPNPMPDTTPPDFGGGSSGGGGADGAW